MTGTNDPAAPRARSDDRPRPERRRFLKSAGAGAAAVVLAGCSLIGGEETDTGTPTGTGTTPTAATDLSGETLKVGVLALAPGANPLGRSMVNGAKLAARQLSEEGVLGADVDVVVADTEGSPGTAVQKYRELVRQDRVDVTVGVFLDQVLDALLPRISSEETLHFTTAAVGVTPAKQITKDYESYKYHFRPGPLNIAQLARAQVGFLERHANRLGWTSAALVVEDLQEFDPFYERVESAAPNHIELVQTARTTVDLKNWGPVFDKVEGAGADLMLVGQSLSGIAAAKIWGTQKRPFEYGGVHLPSQIPRFWTEIDGKCEYIFTMTATTPRSKNTSRTQAFMQAYTEAFDTAPAYAGPTTYDAVKMYADAVRQTGATDPGTLVPYLEERTYADGVVFPKHEFQGRDGTFPHDPVWTSTQETGVPLWHQWQEQTGNGVQAVFAPEQQKMAEYRKPPWIQSE